MHTKQTDMAESKTKASATPATPAGPSPTAGAGAAASASSGPVAESFDDFLDRTGGAEPAAQAQTNPGKAKATPGADPSGEKPTQAQDQDPDDAAAQADAPEGSQEPGGAGEQEQPSETAETETPGDGDPAEAEQEGEGEGEAKPDAPAQKQPTEMGQFERGILSQLKEAKIPEAVQKRIQRAFQKEIANRNAIAERDAILQTKDAENEQLKTQVQAANEKATWAPAGPLAEFDSIEKLRDAVAHATSNLQWAKNPVGMEQFYQDDPAGSLNARTAEEKLSADQEWWLHILSKAPAQQQVLLDRRATRERLRKSHPDFFKPDTESGREVAKLYAADPRTLPDFDQFIADAQRGRREREEEEAGAAKYHRIDMKLARANGVKGGANGSANGHANGASSRPNGSHAEGEKASGAPERAVTLPVPRGSTPRVPIRSGTDPKEDISRRLQTGPVSVEDWADAYGGN